MYISGQISDSGLGAIDCNAVREATEANERRNCVVHFQNGDMAAYRNCQKYAIAQGEFAFRGCLRNGGTATTGGGGKPSNSNAFAMNTNRYSSSMPSAFIPQVQTTYAASPLLRNAGVTRLADGGSIWDSIDVTNLSSADAKSLLNVLPKTNLTPKQLAILNLVTAKANQGTTTTGTTSTTPDVEVEDGTKWIYGIAFGVIGGGLLWTILKK